MENTECYIVQFCILGLILTAFVLHEYSIIISFMM